LGYFRASNKLLVGITYLFICLLIDVEFSDQSRTSDSFDYDKLKRSLMINNLKEKL